MWKRTKQEYEKHLYNDWCLISLYYFRYKNTFFVIRTLVASQYCIRLYFSVKPNHKWISNYFFSKLVLMHFNSCCSSKWTCWMTRRSGKFSMGIAFDVRVIYVPVDWLPTCHSLRLTPAISRGISRDGVTRNHPGHKVIADCTWSHTLEHRWTW